MFYFVSEIMIIVAFLLIEKVSEKKQNLLLWIPASVIGYECFSCLLVGLLTFFHISASIYSVGLINVVVSLGIFWGVHKGKSWQQYYIDWVDVFFVLIFCIGIIILCVNRFGTELEICFETSDPGTHLKMAMNFVNNRAVDGMYLGQATNGLFIEGMQKFFSGVEVYKAFIIKYCINIFMAGWMFFSTAVLGVKKRIGKIFVYIMTVVYVLGYPLNDMLFGFVYLQLTVTVVCYLLFVSYFFFLEKGKTNNWIICLMSLGCLGVGIGYTLFAPLVFISLFLCLCYKAWREKFLFNKSYNFFSLDFCKLGIQIYLVPTFLTIYFLIIQPLIEKNITNYASALNIEGYIYRNLFSDFALYIVFAICGSIICIKNKKITLNVVLLLLGILYEGFFFLKMVNGNVSTYYFYKINYLMWMIILIVFVHALIDMFHREKIYVFTYIVSVFILFGLNITNAESKLQSQNVNYDPYIDSNAFGRIYGCNYSFIERKSEVSPNLVNMCREVEQIEKDSGVVAFVGNWLDRFWYEALTNQRFDTSYNYLQTTDIVGEFKQKTFGKYILVIKDSDEYRENADLFVDMQRLVENDYAFIGYY